MASPVLLAQTNTAAGCDPGQGNVSLSDCLTLGSNGPSVRSVYQTPADLINILVPLLFTIGGLILFFMILLAGFKFIQSGSKGKDEAKSIITAALAGFGIMFVAYWIIQILEAVIRQEILF